MNVGGGSGALFAGPGDQGGGEGRGMVLVPIMMWEEAREMGVPEIEIAGLPGSSVVPPIEKPVGLGVYVWPASVNMAGGWGAAVAEPAGEGGDESSGMLFVPITMWEDASEMGVPETETAGPPGSKVVPPIIRPEACQGDGCAAVMALAEGALAGSGP